MGKRTYRFRPFFIFLVDLALLIISFFIASLISFGEFHPNIFYYSLLLCWIVIWVIIVLGYKLYEIPRILYIDKELTKNFRALVLFLFSSATAIYFLTNYKFSRVFFGTAVLFYSSMLLICRSYYLFNLKKARAKSVIRKEIVIIGINDNVRKIISRVYSRPQYGFKIEGIFTDAKLTGRLKNYGKGGLDEVLPYLRGKEVKELIISLPHEYGEFINELLRYADNNLIRVRIIPEFSEYLSQRFTINYVEHVPFLKFRKEPLQSLTNRFLKRVFDVVFSILIILCVFSWLFPIVAIVIYFSSKGPIFFGQERTGKDGVTFKCWKFRSMRVNNESDTLQATRNDSRVYPFGGFMRRSSIDELPQIFNVLMNQMSVVGPRPHMLKHTEEYRKLVDKFMVRHFAKPGVTGWAQILGYRGETKTVKDMKKRAEADIWYIENWSFMLDLKIIFRTAFSMFFKKDENAY